MDEGICAWTDSEQAEEPGGHYVGGRASDRVLWEAEAVVEVVLTEPEHFSLARGGQIRYPIRMDTRPQGLKASKLSAQHPQNGQKLENACPWYGHKKGKKAFRFRLSTRVEATDDRRACMHYQTPDKRQGVRRGW
jgi:hypothetical protein